MDPRIMALFSALNAGALSALLVAQSGAPMKLIVFAFCIQFLKDLQSVFTPPPKSQAGSKVFAAEER